MRLWRFLLVAGILGALPSAAASVPVHGTIASRGDEQIQGDLQGTLQARLVSFDAFNDHGTGSLNLTVKGARLVLVNYPILNCTSQGIGPYGGYVGQQDLPHQVLRDERFTGTIRATTTQSSAALRVFPLANPSFPLPLNVQGQASLKGGPVPAGSGDFRPNFEGRDLYSGHHMGSLQASNAGPLSFSTAVEAYAYGANIQLTDANGTQTFSTGADYRPESSVHDPLGINNLDAYDRVFLVVFATEAQVSLASVNSQGWHLDAASLQGDLLGSISFEADSTDATINQTLLRQDAGLIELRGRFHLASTYEPNQSVWSIDGSATYVAVNGQPWHVGPAALAGLLMAGGIGLVGLWLLAARWGRSALAVLGFHRVAALENPSRLRILQAIGEHPGVVPADLVRITGLARATVDFHLRRLVGSHLVEAYRDGRQQHLLLNNHSYHVPAQPGHKAGAPTFTAAQVFATLRHPVRQRIFQELLDANRPLRYADFAAAWKASGAPVCNRRNFRFHARRMEQDGLLMCSLVGSQEAWSPSIDYPGLLRRQARQYLSEEDRHLIVEALRSGFLTEQAIHRKLVPKPWPWLEDQLKRLHAAGFLVRNQEGAYGLNQHGAFKYANAVSGDASA
jgi:hypothetical protein